MRWNIKTQLLTLAGVGIVMSLVLGGIGMLSVRTTSQATRDLNIASQAIRHFMHGDMLHEGLRGDVLRAVHASGPAELQAARADLAADAQEFRADLKANLALPLDHEVIAALNELGPALEGYIQQAEQVAELAVRDRAAALRAMPGFDEAFRDMEVRQDKVSDLMSAVNESAVAGAQRAERLSYLLTLVASAMAAVLILFGAVLIVRRIVRSLDEVMRAAKTAEQGDLTVRAEVHGDDELGQTAQTFNRFLDNLQETLTQVAQASHSVASASEELSASSGQISSGAQEQASSLEETAASLEEITSTVKQNADNAQQAAQLAQGAREVAEKGGQVVSTAVAAMGEINASSKKIADIITAIDEIAFQTNLLALNAAVEAARAGEQGRGFAVVAGEVRNLAQRSASAAKEIKGLIQDSVGKVENGSQLVNQSGATLHEIVTSVKRVTDIVSEIAAASREQSAGVTQVGQAVSQMDAVTQSNAAQTEELAGTAESLSAQAEELMAMVNRFKLSSGVAAHASAPAARPKPGRAPLKLVAKGRDPMAGLTPAAKTGTDGEFQEF